MATHDDTDFDEYNPHPYQGGYNLATTYGAPLPPSPHTCYPLSGDSSPKQPQRSDLSGISVDGSNSFGDSAPKEPERSNLSGNSANGSNLSGDSVPKEEERSNLSGDPVPEEGGKWGFFGDYVPEETRRFGNCGGGCRCKCRCSLRRTEEWRCGWSYPERFGCGWGSWNPSRWVGDYLFEYLPVYGEKRAETFHYGNLNYAYDRHTPEPAVSVVVEPDAASQWWSTGSEEQQRHTIFEEAEYESGVQCGYEYDTHTYPVIEYVNAYEGSGFEQPVTVQVELDEHVVQQEEVYQSEVYAYESRNYEESVCIEIEPPQFGQDSCGERTYSLMELFSNGYESGCYEQPVSVPFDSKEHEWSIDVNAHNGDYWDQVSGRCEPHESDYYEPDTDAYIEPFQPAWSRDLRYSEINQGEMHSQINYVNDSRGYDASSHSFWPFQD